MKGGMRVRIFMGQVQVKQIQRESAAVSGAPNPLLRIKVAKITNFFYIPPN
jgi:hypothetical protein